MKRIVFIVKTFKSVYICNFLLLSLDFSKNLKSKRHLLQMFDTIFGLESNFPSKVGS